MEDIIKFDQWLEVNGYSQHTRRDYTQRAADFLAYIKDGNIDQDKLQGYFLEVKQGLSNKTVNCYRDAVGSYLKFKGLDIKVPKRLKEEKKIHDTITFDQFEGDVMWGIYNYFKFPEKPLAILDLMLKSGLRKSEICQLQRKDIDLENMTGKVFRPKCNDWHVFFFDKLTRSRLRVFFDIEPMKTNAFNIGRGGINHIFSKLKNVVTGKTLTPHVMRHSLATKLLKDGVNLRYIQQILGHRNISSTERYTQVNMESLQQQYMEIMEKDRKERDERFKKLMKQ